MRKDRLGTSDRRGKAQVEPIKPLQYIVIGIDCVVGWRSIGVAMRLLRFTLVLILGTCVGGCWDRDISGVYVVGNSRNAYFLQIVEGYDGHLQGRFDFLEMSADGRLQHYAGAMDGAYRNNNIVLNLHVLPVLVTFTMSGTTDAQGLHLNSSGEKQNFSAYFVRSSQEAFQTISQQVHLTSAQVIAKQARDAEEQKTGATEVESEREALRQANNLASAIFDLVRTEQDVMAETDSDARMFDAVKGRYHSLTTGMQNALQRQYSIFGGGQALAARSQISVAINQASIATNQVHIQADLRAQAFYRKVSPLVKMSLNAQARCAGNVTHSNVLEACVKFRESIGAFRKAVETIRSGFEDIEECYRQAKSTQGTIIRDSQMAISRL